MKFRIQSIIFSSLILGLLNVNIGCVSSLPKIERSKPSQTKKTPQVTTSTTQTRPLDNQTTQATPPTATQNTQPTTTVSSQEAQDLISKANLLEKDGNYLGALDVWLELLHLDLPSQEIAKSSIEKDILYYLKENELISLLQKPIYEPFSGWIYFRLGEYATEARDFSSALLHFSSAAKKINDPLWSQKALHYVQDIKSMQNVSAQTIGVVLPLSGKNAEVGKLALRGIQLGLGMHLGASPLKLALVDSESNPDIARRGVDRLVREDRVIGIIGDIVSKSSVAVAAKAEEYKVPVISLSQKSNISDLGPSVFQAAFPSEVQIYFLLRTATKDLGMKRFAILYPNDSYGVEMANQFWDAAQSMGAEVTAVQSYTPNEKDFRFPIQRLIGTFYAEARKDELLKKKAEYLKTMSRHSRRNDARNLLDPIVDFDAVFIPDSTKALGQISAMFAFHDVRKMFFLGTNLWSTPDLVKRIQAPHEVLFVDSLPVDLSSTPFAREFSNIYNTSPGLMETQAYDAAFIFRKALASGVSSRDELIEFLQKTPPIQGAVGTLSPTTFRTFVRPTWAYTIKNKQILPLETSE